MKPFWIHVIWVLFLQQTVVPAAASPSDARSPLFIHGFHNPEDLVRLPGTPWVIASQINFVHVMPPHGFKFGPLEAIHIGTRKVRRLYPTPDSQIDPDRKTYPDCRRPPE